MLLLLAIVVQWAIPPAAAAELAEIQERGYVMVGVKENLPPLGFRDATGKWSGFEIDLAHHVAETLLGDAQAIVLQPLLNQDRLPALLNHQVDLVIARMTVTDARARLVNFSTPYFLDGTALITRDATLQRLTDLEGRSIAVLNGSSTIATVRSLLPKARLVGVESYQAGQRSLDTGEVEAFAADASVLAGWQQNSEDQNSNDQNSDYDVLPMLLSAEALAVALPKGLQYDELRRQVDAAILEWQTSGRLEQRALYWGLPRDGIPDAVEIFMDER